MPASSIAKAPPAGLFHLATDQWTEPFWEAARQHRLVIPCCAHCETYRMPPTPFCPKCLSQAIDWREQTGHGILYSYTIVARAIMTEMADNIPYVPALIELPDAGSVRLITNIVDTPINQITIGANVTITWCDQTNNVTIPMFRINPARADG